MSQIEARNYMLAEEDIPLVRSRAVSGEERDRLKAAIVDGLNSLKATLVAHYYVDGDIQDIADETGGCVSDSLEMARFGRDCASETLIVSGVRFMGETAKILSPEKRVVMPTLEAECSLDLGCPPADFRDFVAAHPDRTVVVYANTSAEVKAISDWVVTSSCALEIVCELDRRGEKILWAPDRHLGDYIAKQTGADMLLWQGACIVHDEFKVKALRDLKRVHPEAGVLVHPESPANVIEMADVVGSTSGILRAARELSQETFIVATDRGLFHKLRQQNPGKVFIEAPTAGNGATCRSCAHCPWMAMNDLESLAAVVSDELALRKNEIQIDAATIPKAQRALDRMLAFQG